MACLTLDSLCRLKAKGALRRDGRFPLQEPESAVFTDVEHIAQACHSCAITTAYTRAILGRQQHHLNMTVRVCRHVQPLRTPVDAAQTCCGPARHSRQRGTASAYSSVPIMLLSIKALLPVKVCAQCKPCPLRQRNVYERPGEDSVRWACTEVEGVLHRLACSSVPAGGFC